MSSYFDSKGSPWRRISMETGASCFCPESSSGPLLVPLPHLVMTLGSSGHDIGELLHLNYTLATFNEIVEMPHPAHFTA